MAEKSEEKRYLIRSAEITQKESSFCHPWNPKSTITGTFLGRLTGLERIGVNLAKIPAGNEAFVYHSHHQEEEWVYILSGRGIAEINGEEYEVAAGDFMGFPAPGVAHHLRNPYDEELVYLMGGENRKMDVADFPHHKKRMIRTEQNIEIFDYEDIKDFGPLES